MRSHRGKTRSELLEIPEFPDEDGNPLVVEVRSLLGEGRAAYMQAIAGDISGDDRQARQVNWNVVWPLLPYLSTFDPETGDMMFDSPQDVLEYDSGAIQRIIDKAQELSGINTDEEAAAGNV